MAEALSNRRQPGIGFVKPVHGRIGLLLGPRPPCLGAGEGEPVPLQICGDNGKPALGVVHGGLDLQEGRRFRGSASHRDRGKNISCPGHRGQPGLRCHKGGGGLDVADDGGAAQQVPDHGSVAAVPRHQLRGPAGPSRQTGRQVAGRPGGLRLARRRVNEQCCPSGVVILEELQDC